MVDESKCLDIPIWEFFNILEHLSFFPGVSRYCIGCLSCASWKSGYGVHDFCCCHLWCWWSLFWWILHKIQNHLSQYRLGVQLDLFLFGALPPFRHFFKLTDVYQWGKMNFCALRPCFIDHLWFTSDFCQVPRRNLFLISPILYPLLLFAATNLHGLRHRNIFVKPKLLCCIELSPFPAIWSSWRFGGESFHTQSCGFTGFQNTRKFLIWSHWFLPRVHSMLTCLACLAKHSRSHRRFQLLSSILDGFFEFLVLRVKEINSS